MTLRSKVLPFLLTALLVAPACSSDDDDDDGGTGPTGDELSTVEFESMVEAMSAINALGVGGIIGLQPASSPALAAQTGTFSYSATESCPNGGTIGLTGTYTFNSSGTSTTGNFTITQTYNTCQAQSTNGTTWTFNGSPDVTFTYNFTVNENGSYTVTGTQTGGIAWGGSGKTGSCSVNLTVNSSATPSGESYTYTSSATGNVCGTTVNETFSYTA